MWLTRFGPLFADEIRRKRAKHMRQFTHWKWLLDEVYVKINGEMRYLWRAVDHGCPIPTPMAGLRQYVDGTRGDEPHGQQ